MNRIVRILISGAAVAGLAAGAAANLVKIRPVTVTFGAPEEIFAKAGTTGRVIADTKRLYFPHQITLDAIAEERGGRAWARSITTNAYESPFRENDVNVSALSALRAATSSQLMDVLREPFFREGPMDSEGTVLWQWRTCNARPGTNFQAIIVAAGFKAGTTNALFLLVSHGKVE